MVGWFNPCKPKGWGGKKLAGAEFFSSPPGVNGLLSVGNLLAYRSMNNYSICKQNPCLFVYARSANRFVGPTPLQRLRPSWGLSFPEDAQKWLVWILFPLLG